MLVYTPLRNIVSNFILLILGPSIYSVMAGLVTTIIANWGILGFAGIIGAIMFIVGNITHFLWVKGDWRLRRWGSQRTAQDLGGKGVVNMPSTPSGATTRPAVATTPPVTQETSKPTPKPETQTQEVSSEA